MVNAVDKKFKQVETKTDQSDDKSGQMSSSTFGIVMDAHVADLQRRADHYRLFAEKTADPLRQARFREIAEAFEREIDARASARAATGSADGSLR